MVSLHNEQIGMDFSDDGREIALTDRKREQIWKLDPKSLVCGMEWDGEERDGLLTPVSIDRVGDETVDIAYVCMDQTAVIRYSLAADHIEAVLLADKCSERIQQAALPGSFQPFESSDLKKPAKRYLLPKMQGMLWDIRGKAFENRYRDGAHSGFSMQMIGCLAEKGAMLCTAETADDSLWLVGKDEMGRSYATNLQEASLRKIRYDRRVRLYFTDASITAVAKRYRARVIERGRFKPWTEKILERPAVQKLFGALFCFIGYCQDDLDYVKECEKLQGMGFEKAFLYPTRFNTFRQDFTMGGFPPISLSREEVQKIKDIGYDVSPWTWITELLGGDDERKARYRRNFAGNRQLFWQMDGQQWFKTCSGTLPAFEREANTDACADATWNHFDVLATSHNNECYALDHEAHPGEPLSRTKDRAFIRETFSADQAAGRIVSSEGFIDAYSMEYDIGSTKAWPLFGPWEFWPIPLTLLVYHDSMLHTWWEPHNYNDHRFGSDCGTYQYGCGRPRIMAAMDALYGSVPQVFPFGAMYAWKRSYRDTYLYKIRLEEPETLYALSLAKPVAKLHEEIGMLEMTGFEILSEDGWVQRTTYADGTQVTANFGPGNSEYLDGIGELMPESWVVTRG